MVLKKFSLLKEYKGLEWGLVLGQGRGGGRKGGRRIKERVKVMYSTQGWGSYFEIRMGI